MGQKTYDPFRDPVGDRLWLKGIRAGPKDRLAIKRQMILRTITQANYVPIYFSSSITFVGKRVKNFRRKYELAASPADWSPG
jgi:hypothetical protein